MPSNIPTPHINCNDKNLIAKTVLMPGDPLRAKYIADAYLTDVICFNETRNMFGYTGYYNGKKISVMGSGMGMASIAIYSYELYNFYDVENIIRIGTSGSYSKDLNINDICIVKQAYTDSNFAKVSINSNAHNMEGSKDLNKKIKSIAKKLKISLTEAKCHSTDSFYNQNNPSFSFDYLRDKIGCKCVDMESFSLFLNAKVSGKNAATLLTISDSFITGERLSREDREKSLHNMIKIALELAD